MSMTNPRVQQLLAIVARAYDRKSWHGTNLRGSIRGLDPAVAARRPGAGRHNIWELVVHAAYWKYVAWRRLTSVARGSFPLEGSNWFARPEQVTLKAWRHDIALLEQTHRTLRAAIADLRPPDLDRAPTRSKVTMQALVTGVAAHDLYHAGQIQLLKRLASR
jgi:uncharacterized damage-inducible protein DinB